MKKLSLLLGTLGGGLAGYLFSNTKLRNQLANAKDAEHAARLLGVHLQKDGKKLAKQIQEFIESEEVQKNVQKAKQFAKKTMDDARHELDSALRRGSTEVRKAVGNTARKAKSKAGAAIKSAKSKARSVSRRVKTNVRRLSS